MMNETGIAEKKSARISKWGGKRPNSGGKREGAGRPKGTPNKVTAEVRSLAQEYGPIALQKLVDMINAKDTGDAARVSACKEILDRAYGKSAQPIEGGETPIDMVYQIQLVGVSSDDCDD